MKKFAFGVPDDQRDAFNTYFLPTSSFVHPLIRVPSFDDIHIPYLPLPPINSRHITRLLYRLRCMFVDISSFNLESAGMASRPSYYYNSNYDASAF